MRGEAKHLNEEAVEKMKLSALSVVAFRTSICGLRFKVPPFSEKGTCSGLQ